MTQATQTIKRHMLLLDVMLGYNHPLAIRWQELFTAWERKVMFLETFCATPDMPSRLLLARHLREYQWMKTAIATPDQADVLVIVPVPAFADVLDRLELDDFNVPLLPAHYTAARPADKPPPCWWPTFIPSSYTLGSTSSHATQTTT